MARIEHNHEHKHDHHEPHRGIPERHSGHEHSGHCCGHDHGEHLQGGGMSHSMASLLRATGCGCEGGCIKCSPQLMKAGGTELKGGGAAVSAVGEGGDTYETSYAGSSGSAKGRGNSAAHNIAAASSNEAAIFDSPAAASYQRDQTVLNAYVDGDSVVITKKVDEKHQDGHVVTSIRQSRKQKATLTSVMGMPSIAILRRA